MNKVNYLEGDYFINEIFSKVIPHVYAEELRKQFIDDPSMWYRAITPKSKADELIDLTDNDYSKIWDEHCACCFIEINKDFEEDCYMSEDKMTWLCKRCYDYLKANNKL